MLDRSLIGAFTLAAVLARSGAAAGAFDETKYPDLEGQWIRIGPGNCDPAKPPGRERQPPLTAEYQSISAPNFADQANGGLGCDPSHRRVPARMPCQIEFFSMLRLIRADDRAWPENPEPQFIG